MVEVYFCSVALDRLKWLNAHFLNAALACSPDRSQAAGAMKTSVGSTPRKSKGGNKFLDRERDRLQSYPAKVIEAIIRIVGRDKLKDSYLDSSEELEIDTGFSGMGTVEHALRVASVEAKKQGLSLQVRRGWSCEISPQCRRLLHRALPEEVAGYDHCMHANVGLRLCQLLHCMRLSGMSLASSAHSANQSEVFASRD